MSWWAHYIKMKVRKFLFSLNHPFAINHTNLILISVIPNSICLSNIPHCVDSIYRNEDLLIYLRPLNLALNLYLDLSFWKDHELVSPMNKVCPNLLEDHKRYRNCNLLNSNLVWFGLELRLSWFFSNHKMLLF